LGKPSPCLRSRVKKTTSALNCATKPSSSALAAAPTLSFQIFAILGRESTPEALAFLGESGF
jgi:hypothetical protein